MVNKDTSPQVIGARIKTLRELYGFSQKELARRAEVSRSDVSLWEIGKMRPSYEKASRLCDVLGIELNYLLRGVTSYLRHDMAIQIIELERESEKSA